MVAPFRKRGRRDHETRTRLRELLLPPIRRQQRGPEEAAKGSTDLNHYYFTVLLLPNFQCHLRVTACLHNLISSLSFTPDGDAFISLHAGPATTLKAAGSSSIRRALLTCLPFSLLLPSLFSEVLLHSRTPGALFSEIRHIFLTREGWGCGLVWD